MNLIIDKDYFEDNNLEVPKTYEDLLKDEYKDLIAMPDPKTSGTGYAFFLNVVNIMGEEEAIKYAEERRVFYVALTRTKNKVYLLVDQFVERRSDFIKEIIDIINNQ